MPATTLGSEGLPGARRAPTIIDIAAAAGVSKSTVSRVLNGAPTVAPATRAKVMAAVDRLGYRINTAARSLRTARSALVGLLVPAIAHETFAQIAERLDESLREHEVALAITSSRWDTSAEVAALDMFSSRGVDALVVALADDRASDIAATLKRSDAPILLLDREVRGLTCDAVLTDHRTGTLQAVDHLTALGHTCIGLVTMTDRTRPGREALAAYQAAIEGRGMVPDPRLVHPIASGNASSAADALEQIVDAGATAVIAGGSTSVVAAVLHRASDLRLQIPADLSLIAFDESALAAVKAPRLTTISRPVDEIGRLAGRMVVARMANPGMPPRVEFIRMGLRVRESTAAPRS